MSGMAEDRRAAGRREFFARRVRNMLPPEFYRDLEAVERMVNTMSRRDILAKYSELGTRTVTFELVKPFVFLVKSEDVYEAVKRGYVAPSMFVKYRQCARALAIELLSARERGGVLVTIDGLRSLLRGVLVHKLYYERYAVGETEVMVVSERNAIVGYADEVRRWGGGVAVIELKSSYRPDVVGSSLQVMAYMLALSDQLGVPPERVEGYVVSPATSYRVAYDPEAFDEYVKRLRKVVEIATSGALDQLPPGCPQTSAAGAIAVRTGASVAVSRIATERTRGSSTPWASKSCTKAEAPPCSSTASNRRGALPELLKAVPPLFKR